LHCLPLRFNCIRKKGPVIRDTVRNSQMWNTPETSRDDRRWQKILNLIKDFERHLRTHLNLIVILLNSILVTILKLDRLKNQTGNGSHDHFVEEFWSRIDFSQDYDGPSGTWPGVWAQNDLKLTCHVAWDCPSCFSCLHQMPPCCQCCTTISGCGSARWERVGAVPEHVRAFVLLFLPLCSNTGAHRQSADWQTLMNWCKSYGLASSGNKTTLKDWLRGFSRDRDQWERWALRQPTILQRKLTHFTLSKNSHYSFKPKSCHMPCGPHTEQTSRAVKNWKAICPLCRCPF